MTVEEDAFAGIAPRSYDDRLALLEEACQRLLTEGFPVWLAGSSPQVREMAVRNHTAIHFWNPDREKLLSPPIGFTWGAVLDGHETEVSDRLRAPMESGASWAVCGYRGGLDAPEAFTKLQRGYALAQQTRR